MKENARKKWIAIGVLVLIILISAVIYLRVGRPMTELVKDSERFRTWVHAHGWKSRAVFIAMVCLQVIVAIIPGEPLELAAGYVFGAFEGTLLCLAGIVAGSMMVFALVRTFGRRLVEVFFPREKIDSLRILRNPKRLYTVTAILMVLPGTPKDLLTYCVGLTKIPVGTWLLICTLGRIPSVLTSTLCAQALSEGDYRMAIIVFATTAALCGLGFAVYAKIKAKHSDS